MIAKPSPKGFADLVPRPQQKNLPDRFEYMIVYRRRGQEYSIFRQSARKTLIAYSKLKRAGVEEIEVWKNNKVKIELERRGYKIGPTEPKYKFARGGK